MYRPGVVGRDSRGPETGRAGQNRKRRCDIESHVPDTWAWNGVIARACPIFSISCLTGRYPLPPFAQGFYSTRPSSVSPIWRTFGSLSIAAFFAFNSSTSH